MTMPIDLVLVRHGESEGNIAGKASENGDKRHFTQEYRNRHSSRWKLSDKGIVQAKKTGEYIKQQLGGEFDRQYMSHYLRAQETAYHLDLINERWNEDIFIRERNWGDFDRLPVDEQNKVYRSSAEEIHRDPFYWRPPNGESIADVLQRLKSTILDTLHRDCSQMRVIMVCHGEIMWSMRFLLEGWSVAQYYEAEANRDPKAQMRNCQVLHYTRKKADGSLSDRLVGVTSLAPYFDDEWEKPLEVSIDFSAGRGFVTRAEIGELLKKHPRIVYD